LSEKKKLPLTQHLGRINLDSWTVYDSVGQIVIISDNKCIECKSSDRPIAFIDLQMIQDPKSPAYKGLQLHLGLSGKRIHRSSSKKRLKRTRVDIYLSKEQVKDLHRILSEFIEKLGLK